jgi:DNA replication protein DnaC
LKDTRTLDARLQLLEEGHLDKGALKLSTADVSRLSSSGLMEEPHEWDVWDDSRLKDVTMKGHKYTAAQLAFMWAKMEAGPRSRSGLALVGKPGVGKSHLARLTAIYVSVVHQVQAVYVNWPLYITQRRMASGGGESTISRQARLISADLLVLDDPFREKPSAFSIQELYPLVERRGMTIITSNTDPSQWRPHITGNGDAEAARTTAEAIRSRLGANRRITVVVRMEAR